MTSTTPTPTHDDIRDAVRAQYGAIAERGSTSCCGPAGCSGLQAIDSTRLGYSADDLAALPEGVDMGLGCGNPQALASLEPGATVLDLGAGAGFDAFLAAKRVGPSGQVIGVDMTAEMVRRARDAARADGVDNVDFRLGEIERLPVADATVDVVMSNCVINLSPDKPAVFREAHRVLRPGGRLAIHDVVALQPLPPDLAQHALAITGCVAGAATVDELRAALSDAGFVDVTVQVDAGSRAFIADWFPGSGAEDYVASAAITATRPGAGDTTSCCEPSCCA